MKSAKHMRPLRPLTAVILIACLALTAFAAGTAGQLDPTFDGDGVALTTNDYGSMPSVARQSSGKIVVGGTERVPMLDGGSGTGWLVRRLDPDGSLDTSFGASGEVHLFGPSGDVRATDSLRALTTDSSNRIIAVGSGSHEVTTGKGKKKTTSLVRRFTVVRLTSNGALDSSFGGDGVVVVDLSDVTGGHGRGEAVHVLSGGQILVAGQAFNVAAESSDGGGGGKGKKGGGGGNTTTSDAIALVRLVDDGSFDSSFGAGGIVIDDLSDGDDEPWPGALGIQSTGRIVVGSVARDIDEQWVLSAYASDGTPDATFGRVVVSDAFLRGFAIDASDRILGCGYALDAAGDAGFVLMRHASDGSIDTTFGVGGSLELGLSERSEGAQIVLQSDGKIIAGLNIIDSAGLWRAQPIRATADGSVDTTFGSNGYGDVLEAAGTHYGLLLDGFIDTDGNVVLGGVRQDAVTGDADWLVGRWCTE